MRRHRIGTVCGAVLGILVAAGCDEGPVADVGQEVLGFASSGTTLFVLSRGDEVHPGTRALHALRGTDLTRLWMDEAGSEPVWLSLVATPSGDAYFAVGEARIGRWDGTELTWIEMPGAMRALAAYDEHVWAQSIAGSEQVLSRIEGGEAIEVRRDPTGSTALLRDVLPTGNAVLLTGDDIAEEVDRTGAVVGPFPVDRDVIARDGVAITIHQQDPSELEAGGMVTFASDGRAPVTERFRGAFAGAGAGTFDDIDWVNERYVQNGFLDNGDDRYSPVICVLHFDGTSATERFCTAPIELYDRSIVHADSVFYAARGSIYEVPLR